MPELTPGRAGTQRTGEKPGNMGGGLAKHRGEQDEDAGPGASNTASTDTHTHTSLRINCSIFCFCGFNIFYMIFFIVYKNICTHFADLQS